ncbi:MAG: 4Fe-4S binding protein, partial [Oscillospiraceae bacterium]|nr:4Fe-4S binding protein [Oscillospiraceae bacterium]
LAYKIKAPKLILRLRFLRYIKYAVLVIFVVILPISATHELSGLGQPWFCKYICPSGTTFGAIPLLGANDLLRQFIGAQFVLKLSIALGLIVAAVFIYRFFCRVLCPLGAIYAIFNKISILHMHCDKNKCISCGNCAKACHIKIEPNSQPNSPECVRCGKCVDSCAQKALCCSVKKTNK